MGKKEEASWEISGEFLIRIELKSDRKEWIGLLREFIKD